MVDNNFSKLRLLLLGIGGQIPSSVVGFRHLRIFLIIGISAFHIVVHMRQCPRSHIVIIPIGNNGNERLRRCIVRKVIHTLHPVFCSIIGMRSTTIILAQVLRGIVNLPVPTVGRHTEEHLVGVHYLGGIIINALKPTPRRNRTRCRTRPSHTVTHNGCRITVFIQITIHAPVLATDRTVDRSHTGKADVHFLGGVIGFDGFVDVFEHSRGCSVGGIIVTFLKVDIHATAPRVFFHNTNKFGAEVVLCAICVVTDSLKNRICTIICNGKQPTDVWPFVNIGQHIADCNTAFSNRSCGVYLKRKQTNGIDAVTVVTERLIHSGIAHERPHHDAFAF